MLAISTFTGRQVWSQTYRSSFRQTYMSIKKIHIVLRNPTRTHPHNPASPESLRTGDILCCIWFEIISNNRWVLFFFPKPASQPRAAPQALVAAKIRKASHARRLVQFSSQCPPMLLPPNTPLHQDGFLFRKYQRDNVSFPVLR